MSFQFLSSLNKPPLVLATGCAITAGFPFIPVGGLSLGLLKVLNVLAFATNVSAVSVPGRIDSDQDIKMRSGDLNPSTETTPLTSRSEGNPETQRQRNLVLPVRGSFFTSELIPDRFAGAIIEFIKRAVPIYSNYDRVFRAASERNVFGLGCFDFDFFTGG